MEAAALTGLHEFCCQSLVDSERRPVVLSEGPGAAGVCLTEAWVVLSEAGVGVGGWRETGKQQPVMLVRRQHSVAPLSQC